MAARVRAANFALYLTLVGALAIGFFVAGKPVLFGYSRYVLLGIVFPIGLTASLLALETCRIGSTRCCGDDRGLGAAERSRPFVRRRQRTSGSPAQPAAHRLPTSW